jgi:hypothetical protein
VRLLAKCWAARSEAKYPLIHLKISPRSKDNPQIRFNEKRREEDHYQCEFSVLIATRQSQNTYVLGLTLNTGLGLSRCSRTTSHRWARSASLATTKPLCRLLQHRTLYSRVLGKLDCPLLNTRALDKGDCSSAHLRTREKLEGTTSDQRVRNDLSSNHHLPTHSPSRRVYYLPKQRIPSPHPA